GSRETNIANTNWLVALAAGELIPQQDGSAQTSSQKYDSSLPRVFRWTRFRGADGCFLRAFRATGWRRLTPRALSSTSSTSLFSAGVTTLVNFSGRSATNC